MKYCINAFISLMVIALFRYTDSHQELILGLLILGAFALAANGTLWIADKYAGHFARRRSRQ